LQNGNAPGPLAVREFGDQRRVQTELDIPTFLAENTDIVISHQMENPLNYFYLEVCWQGYPLVHNASLCDDLGYYYRDNDAEAASKLPYPQCAP
jgi:hypothetical protein